MGAGTTRVSETVGCPAPTAAHAEFRGHSCDTTASWAALRSSGTPPGRARLARLAVTFTGGRLFAGMVTPAPVGLPPRPLAATERATADPGSTHRGGPASGRRQPSSASSSCPISWSSAAPSRRAALAAWVSATTRLGAARACARELTQTAPTIASPASVTRSWASVARQTARTLALVVHAPALAVSAARGRTPTRPPRGILWPR
jgi:hypothetical protein